MCAVTLGFCLWVHQGERTVVEKGRGSKQGEEKEDGSVKSSASSESVGKGKARSQGQGQEGEKAEASNDKEGGTEAKSEGDDRKRKRKVKKRCLQWIFYLFIYFFGQ